MVTALFMDVVASRSLTARLGAETASELVNDALDLAYPVVYRYEGSIAQLQDDELLAFFGAPVVHEDDPVRAVRAALDLLDSVHQYASAVKTKHGVDFGVRISLSTGPVTLGPVGEALKYEYSALGGTLNLVTQVEAAKLPMTVLMTEYTYRFVAPFFDTTDLGEVSAGNMSRPTHIYRVEFFTPHPGPGTRAFRTGVAHGWAQERTGLPGAARGPPAGWCWPGSSHPGRAGHRQDTPDQRVATPMPTKMLLPGPRAAAFLTAPTNLTTSFSPCCVRWPKYLKWLASRRTRAAC